MPRDHFVSQVHLRKFCFPDENGSLNATRKHDGSYFTPRPHNVCVTKNNSTTPYLADERIIEEFLEEIEPKYSSCVARLRQNQIDEEVIYVIAGFAAYIMTCSPTSLRLHAAQLRSEVLSVTDVVEKNEPLISDPELFHGKHVSKLVDEGKVDLWVDPKFPQALGTTRILETISLFGNSRWDIITNCTRSGFFTSDFPAAIEPQGKFDIVNRIVPLAPDLAIRMIPDVSLRDAKLDFSFSKLRYRFHKASHKDVVCLNRKIVQCAEDFVFSQSWKAWMRDFIMKYGKHYIKADLQRIPTENGFMNVGRLRIVRKNSFFDLSQ